MMNEETFKVSEEDIEEMFNFADKDGDGKISYTEFQIMINPPKPPEPPKPTLADLARVAHYEEKNMKDIDPLEQIMDIKTPETKSTPLTVIAEPQTLSVENILIHNAKTKDSPLRMSKSKKGKKEKGEE